MSCHHLQRRHVRPHPSQSTLPTLNFKHCHHRGKAVADGAIIYAAKSSVISRVARYTYGTWVRSPYDPINFPEHRGRTVCRNAGGQMRIEGKWKPLIKKVSLSSPSFFLFSVWLVWRALICFDDGDDDRERQQKQTKRSSNPSEKHTPNQNPSYPKFGNQYSPIPGKARLHIGFSIITIVRHLFFSFVPSVG